MTKKELMEEYNINKNEFVKLTLSGEEGEFYTDDECWEIDEFYGYFIANKAVHKCYYHPTQDEIEDLSSIDFSNPVRIEEM